MSIRANARDREHKERVRQAAPKLLEALHAMIEAAEKHTDAITWGRFGPAMREAREVIAAIAATQPPPKPRGRR